MKVAFYKGTQGGFQGIVNRLVRWWTRGPYSHCELVINEKLIVVKELLGDGITGSGDSVCASSSGMDGGVRFKHITLHPESWDVIDIPDSFVSVDACAWFRKHNGEPYSWAGDFGFIWRPLKSARRKWFCSEAVAAALGFRQSWRFDPNTLFVILTRT